MRAAAAALRGRCARAAGRGDAARAIARPVHQWRRRRLDQPAAGRDTIRNEHAQYIGVSQPPPQQELVTTCERAIQPAEPTLRDLITSLATTVIDDDLLTDSPERSKSVANLRSLARRVRTNINATAALVELDSDDIARLGRSEIPGWLAELSEQLSD
jgi:hypothetical protein